MKIAPLVTTLLLSASAAMALIQPSAPQDDAADQVAKAACLHACAQAQVQDLLDALESNQECVGLVDAAAPALLAACRAITDPAELVACLEAVNALIAAEIGTCSADLQTDNAAAAAAYNACVAGCQ